MDLLATARHLASRLPRGHTLPCAVWERRHRWMVRVLWAHVPALVLFAVARGYTVQHGLLDSAWTQAEGRRRRVYRLMRAGRRELAARREEWRGFARAVEAVLA